MEIDSNESNVPKSVMESVNSTLTDLRQLRSDFIKFLSLSDPNVLAQMQSLQSAQTLLLIAKTATTLLALRLRCTAVIPNDHPVKSELERIELYESKRENFMDLSKVTDDYLRYVIKSRDAYMAIHITAWLIKGLSQGGDGSGNPKIIKGFMEPFDLVKASLL